MSVEDGISDATNKVSDSVDGTKKTEDMVSYESHRKLLGEKKDLSAKRAKELEELTALREWKSDQELKKKEEDGDYKEVISSLREELKDTKTKMGETTKKVAFDKFSDQIKNAAKQSGCVDAETLVSLLTKEQMASVQTDDKLNANKDDLSRLLGDLKEARPYMFDGNNINHTAVNIGGFKKKEAKTVNEMSKDELITNLRSLES